MKSSLPSPTKAQAARIDWIKHHGCAACRKLNQYRPADAHHILSGGRRISHDHTIPLCEWHHRGYPPGFGVTKTQAEGILGPSMAENKRAFVAQFGTEADLLQTTNELYTEHLD